MEDNGQEKYCMVNGTDSTKKKMRKTCNTSTARILT